MPAPVHRFPVGETFTYSVDWRLFSAGTATLRVESAGPELRVLGTADATGAVELLYHVHDTFESFVDAKSYCSRMITKHTEEGFRKLDTNIAFDGARRKSTLTEHNLKNGERKSVENDIPPCVTDVLSAVFYIGSLALSPNTNYEFPLNDGGKTATVHATVEGLEQVKTPAGMFNTVRVRASGTGPQKSKGDIWVWYTDDGQHLPVQMKAKMFWGTLTFHLLPSVAVRTTTK